MQKRRIVRLLRSYFETPPERGAFFKLAVLVYEKVTKMPCKVKEMAAKAKYTKGCQILAEITTRNIKAWTTFEHISQNY